MRGYFGVTVASIRQGVEKIYFRRKTSDKQGGPIPNHAREGNLDKVLIRDKVFNMKAYRLNFFVCLFLAALVFLVYWQVLDYDFVGFDDYKYVAENTEVRAGVTRKGFIWAFTQSHAGNWHPITWLSHMLDCDLFGLNAGRHHLTNLLFHIANTLLLFLVFRKMTGAIWKSGFVAALFALHPLHVESVAWVAERKDVLSTFFWMLTMWAYVRYAVRPKFGRYILVLIFFALGLMSKPMLVTLPFVLLLMDFWPLGRLQGCQWDGKSSTPAKKGTFFHLILEKAPLFGLTVILSFITLLALAQQGKEQSFDVLPLSAQISNALVSYVMYIGKTIWPKGLAVFYPFPRAIPIWQVVGAGLLLMGLSVVFIRAWKKRPYLAVGWLWFLGTLVPVIGVVQAGNQAMADRYTYIPLIGLFIMCAWGVPDLVKKWHYRKMGFGILTGLVLSTLMVCTWLQVQQWRDGISLFQHALKVTENNYVAHTNLGVLLNNKGRQKEAIEHHYEAIRIDPYFADAHNNLGIALHGQGKTMEGTKHFFEAIQIKPDFADAYHNLGNAMILQRNLKDAEKYFKKAIEIDPYRGDAYYNLGIICLERGEFRDAADRFSEALSIRPDFPVARTSLEIALEKLGEQKDALRKQKEVLKNDPNNVESYELLARRLETQGNFEGAAKHYKEVIRIDPDNVNAHYNLGNTLAHQGVYEEAIAHYMQVLRVRPDSADTHNNLGIVLARQGNLEEAVKHYSEALRIDPGFVRAHYNLGTVFERKGKPKEAVKQYSKALRIDPGLKAARSRLEMISKSSEKIKKKLP